MRMRSSAGFTLMELLIVVSIIGVLASISVQALLRARLSGNEASAIASLRAINSAQVAYSTGCGGSGYAVLFPTLGVPPPGGTQAFLSQELTVPAPQKSGYNFTLAPGFGAGAGPTDCNGTATQTAYYATAVPISFAISGNRSFATNTAAAIWQASAAAAPTEPFAAPATPVQ